MCMPVYSDRYFNIVPRAYKYTQDDDSTYGGEDYELNEHNI